MRARTSPIVSAPIACTLALGLGMLSTGAQAVAPFSYAAYGYFHTLPNDTDVVILSGDDQSVTGTASVLGADGQKARASYGDNGVALPNGGGYAVSAWSDGFVVNGGSGGGTLNLSVHLHGTLFDPQDVNYALLLSGDPNAFSSAAIVADAGAGYINLPGTTHVLLVEVDATPDYPSGSGAIALPVGPVDQLFSVSIPFVYGQALYLASVLDIGGYGDFYNSASFGITAPDGASINSLSGALYPTAAVPEAETYAMMLAGLGLVGFAARRHKVAKD